MKFLCVPCDKPMKLISSSAPGGGSMSVVYGCPDCGYEMAMLTNPYETQLVSSLGVRIGPAGGAAEGPKCPFPAMVEGDAAEKPGPATPGPRWTPEAEARMESIPSFVRPMARSGIEKFAEENGYAVIDGNVLDEAKARFGM